jgi:phenylalanyl-tRNA synthetase alpha chain
MEPFDDASLRSLIEEALAKIALASTAVELADIEAEVVGRRSPFASRQKALGALAASERAGAGAKLQTARQSAVNALDARRIALTAQDRIRQLEADRLDLGDVVVADASMPIRAGHASLVAVTQAALEDVFVAMGYTVAEGPEAESDWYNFEALNMPPAHPARGMWDTLYLELGEPETVLLRTHTSPTQIHLMERAVAESSLPIHAVMPGRCFRRDTPDARHLAVFHQIEGLVVDHGISFADLAGTIEAFTRAYFGADMQARLRPSYFPFTEPSAEFEITCAICRGEGCRTCSDTGWVELGGCGMVDPAVFESVGIDSEEWTGFAFGFGIDRCAQMRHGIADLRTITENDARFLRQFG